MFGARVEKESLEHEKFGLVDPMIQGEQAAHLAHPGGRLLVRCQGEGHHSVVPLKGVQGMELCELCLRDS